MDSEVSWEHESFFCIQVIIQRASDVKCDIFDFFKDFKKAFDKVLHGKLIGILQATGIDGKDIRLIKLEQQATVSLENELSEIFAVEKREQLALFNIYSENALLSWIQY